jgi:hypothetical protein
MNWHVSSLQIKNCQLKFKEYNTYIVNGAFISFSCYDMFATSLICDLCFGLLSKFVALSSRSSLLCSDKSGILALGITVKGAKDSVASDLTALGLPIDTELSKASWPKV